MSETSVPVPWRAPRRFALTFQTRLSTWATCQPPGLSSAHVLSAPLLDHRHALDLDQRVALEADVADRGPARAVARDVLEVDLVDPVPQADVAQVDVDLDHVVPGRPGRLQGG